MQERRKTPRRRTFLGGVIAFNKRYATLECTVRNMSDSGARISLEGSVVLPDEFDFTFTRSGQSYRAQMVWRDAGAAGIALLAHGSGGVVTLDWARRLQAREAENATLRRRVADLSGAG